MVLNDEFVSSCEAIRKLQFAKKANRSIPIFCSVLACVRIADILISAKVRDEHT